MSHPCPNHNGENHVLAVSTSSQWDLPSRPSTCPEVSIIALITSTVHKKASPPKTQNAYYMLLWLFPASSLFMHSSHQLTIFYRIGTITSRPKRLHTQRSCRESHVNQLLHSNNTSTHAYPSNSSSALRQRPKCWLYNVCSHCRFQE